MTGLISRQTTTASEKQEIPKIKRKKKRTQANRARKKQLISVVGIICNKSNYSSLFFGFFVVFFSLRIADFRVAINKCKWKICCGQSVEIVSCLV